MNEFSDFDHVARVHARQAIHDAGYLRIVRIDIQVSGPALIDPIEIPVSRADFLGGCRWFSDLPDLPAGTYLVKFNAIGAGGDVIAHARTQQVVDPARPATIRLECDFSRGDVVLCIGPCPPGSPTPRPSASATPQPSPTPSFVPPSPSPSPGPLPPLAGWFDRVHGLHADDQGNVYLFGLKPKPWPDDYRIGRTVEIAPGGALRVLDKPNAPVKDLVLYEGYLNVSPSGGIDSFLGFAGAPPGTLPLGERLTANRTLMRLQDGQQFVGYNRHMLKGEFLRPWGASGGDGSYMALGTKDPKHVAGYLIGQSSGIVHVDRTKLVGGRSAAVERPLSLDVFVDFTKRTPVWTCKRGILMPGARPTDEPKVLVSRPAYGLTRVSAATKELLFTTYEAGDTQVRYVDAARGGAYTTAYTFLKGSPHRIEKGADGFIYVLLAEPPLPFDAASDGDPYMHEFPGTRAVRVVKMRFDAATKKLVEPQLIADTFQDPAPSW